MANLGNEAYDVEDHFLGKCPSCDYEMTVHKGNLLPLPPQILNLFRFIKSLPAFSETPVKIIKHGEQLRLEVEKTIEKIVL